MKTQVQALTGLTSGAKPMNGLGMTETSFCCSPISDRIAWIAETRIPDSPVPLMVRKAALNRVLEVPTTKPRLSKP